MYLCQEAANEGHSIIVFCPTKRQCESMAHKLAQNVTCALPPESKAEVYKQFTELLAEAPCLAL